MRKKNFVKNNEAFICENCGEEVGEHPTSSRDHCNKCLFSKHVDINPGDRENTCQGMLIPIGVESKSGKEQIVYRCEKCNKKIVNVSAADDDREKIVELYGKVW